MDGRTITRYIVIGTRVYPSCRTFDEAERIARQALASGAADRTVVGCMDITLDDEEIRKVLSFADGNVGWE